MSLVLDIHALQTVPPSNMNRDDTGAPKSAIFGGVPRQRVSSQSWKRAIRRTFRDELAPGSIGFRSKHVADLIVEKILETTEAAGERWEESRAVEAVRALFQAAKISLKEPKATTTGAGSETAGAATALEVMAGETGYLLFLSSRQIENAARELIALDGQKPAKKDADRVLDTEHSIDIALFGRMVADASAYNVDASCQVAHAIGIHASEPEFDYYTAVDDVVEDREEAGAGMIGTMQMMSSTLYRFATVDMASLTENLGDAQAATEAALAFVRAFITSLPTGKQNSYAHNTLPELVYITVRESRSVSLVNAFESALGADCGTDRRTEGAVRLAREAIEIQTNYDLEPEAAFVIGLGDLAEPFVSIATRTDLASLESQLRDAMATEARP